MLAATIMQVETAAKVYIFLWLPQEKKKMRLKFFFFVCFKTQERQLLQTTDESSFCGTFVKVSINGERREGGRLSNSPRTVTGSAPGMKCKRERGGGTTVQPHEIAGGR